MLTTEQREPYALQVFKWNELLRKVEDSMTHTASRMEPDDALEPSDEAQAARYAALNALTSAEVAAQANKQPTRVYVGTDWINVCPTEIEGVFDYRVSPQTALRLIETWKATLA